MTWIRKTVDFACEEIKDVKCRVGTLKQKISKEEERMTSKESQMSSDTPDGETSGCLVSKKSNRRIHGELLLRFVRPCFLNVKINFLTPLTPYIGSAPNAQTTPVPDLLSSSSSPAEPERACGKQPRHLHS